MRTRTASRLLPTLACGTALSVSAFAQATLYTLNPDKSADKFGWSARGAGDVNNDGRPDFIVGATENNLFTGGEGYARVFSGATGLPLYTFNGVTVDDGFGTSVDGAGDLNNDGFDDVIVGAPFVINAGTLRGAITVFSGKTGGIIGQAFGPVTNDQLGGAVAGAGDINHDGVPDLIVGAPDSANGGNQRGKAIVYSGATGATLYTVNGTANGERRGVSVDGVGDVNGDSFGDFIVGSFTSAKLFSGANGALLMEFSAPLDDRLGVSVSGAGDVNADGIPDVLVGASQDVNIFVPGPGYVKVFSGAGFAPLLTLVGDLDGDRFGFSVASAGDVNGDGRADVLVGADQAASGGNGYVRLFSGNGGGVIHTAQGQGFDDRFGQTLDGLGDVNGDSKRDYIVGAPGRDVPFMGGGEATVHSAGPNCPTPTNYCPATPNSTGNPALISYSGSTSIAANNFTLTTSQCPPGTFGIFLMGPNQGSMPLGNGTFCIGAPFYRIGSINQSISGTSSRQLDFSIFNPPIVIQPGAVFNFQLWFRNNLAGGGLTNLTNGLSVTLCE